MYRLPRRLLIIAIGIIAALTTIALTVLSVRAQTPLSEQSKLAINGIGPVRVGMTVPQAAAAAGVSLVVHYAGSDNCYYLRPQDVPKDLAFMVIDNQIARVDIERESRIKTVSGAKIGDSEARIKSLYPGQIRVTNHQYVEGGHYLTFVPKDTADKNYRLVFETGVDGQVTTFRSGKLPEVEYVEGCA